jgi:hypothetical protein
LGAGGTLRFALSFCPQMQGLWTRELIYCICENVQDLGRLYASFCGILSENLALKCHSRISLLSRNARFCQARTRQNARILPAGFSGDILSLAQGLAGCPPPFKCTITPCSAHHAEVIEHEFATPEEAFAPYEHGLREEDRAFVKAQCK